MNHLQTSVAHLATGFYRYRKGLLTQSRNLENETWSRLAGEILAARATQWLETLTDEELAGIISGTVDVEAALVEVALRLKD